MFANSSGLWLLALWLPLTMLLSSPRNYPRRIVSGLWLWSGQQTTQRRSRAWRLPPRHTWPWYVSIGCLALAAAEPQAHVTSIPAPKVVFVVDTSASMSAQEEGGTRLALAKNRIGQWLDRALPGTEILLVPSHAPTSANTQFHPDGEQLRASLRTLQSTALHARLQPAVTLATNRLRVQPGSAKLIIVTDGTLVDDSPLFVETTAHEIWMVGSKQPNHAIIRARVTPVSSAGNEHQVRVSLAIMNFNDRPLRTSVSLRQHNATTIIAREEVWLDPATESTVTLTYPAVPSDAGTGIIAELTTTDAMTVDDVAYLVVPHFGPRAVALPRANALPGPNVLAWVERALHADPEVRITERSDLSDTSTDALIVFVNECPSVVPDHDYLIIDPPYGSCLSIDVGPEVNNPTLTTWREADQRFRYVNPSEQRLARGRALQSDAMTALLEAREGVMMAHLEHEGKIGTVLGFSLDHSDWPSRPSFVMFIRNLVHHARSAQVPSFKLGESSGDYSLLLPKHIKEFRLRSPNGDRSTLEAADAELALPEYGVAGFYHMSWSGSRAGSALVGVSVLHVAESNPHLVAPQVVGGIDAPDHQPKSPPRLLDAGLVVLGLLAMSIPLTLMRRPLHDGHDS